MGPPIVRCWALFVFVFGLMACGTAIPVAGVSASELVEVVDVEPVWTGHPVGFALLTYRPHQFVAYYDAQRQMTVAQRSLDCNDWQITKLPSYVKWDSHNYVTMAIDRAGHLHLAGNMHCVPLVYFRTTEEQDAQTLTRVPQMVGPDRERRVTYPVFLRGPDGQLIFRYRDGSSGSGDDIYNAYDESSRTWRRLLDAPLTSGQGKMNAYCSRPKLGPDNWYHIVWVWRDTPDCATNHDLSYARSRDLVHWETAAGQPLPLPITVDAGTVVDPVPPSGGIINGGNRLGFDSQNRPVIAYHKYDKNGDTQIYVARFEEKAWRVRQISDWKGYRWEFSGGGSIPFEVRLNAVERVGHGLRVACTYGRGKATWTLNESTLEPVVDLKQVPALSRQAKKSSAGRTEPQRSGERPAAAKPPTFAGLVVRSAGDNGIDAGHHYRLQWYSLGPNRDRPRQGPPPPPAMLQVLKYVD